MMLLNGTYQPSPDNFLLAEQGILEQIQGQAVYWYGRAATALYDAYRLAHFLQPLIAQPEIIMPAMMCATAANTAHIAGVKPRFADVDPHTGLITLEHIKARFTANTIAVVAIHLYGQMVDIEPIRAWCKQKNVLLIEDPTQALGAKYPDGTQAGSKGDVAICSTRGTKIINAGNGFLTLNTRDMQETFEAMVAEDGAAQSAEPNADTNLALALSYRNLHHSLVGLLRLRSVSVQTASDSFMAVRPAYEALYLQDADPTVDLNSAWQGLEANLQHRFDLAENYTETLQDSASWQLLTGYHRSGVCWRYSLLLNNVEKQVAFSEVVRRDGFHVSNLYWAVNQFFNPADECPNSDQFGRRIVNLWVDSSVDADYVRRCCDSLLKHAAIL